jgi:NAD(P)-dependent dehydrogenase (short-subunit alcohol dehydrogenase family)
MATEAASAYGIDLFRLDGRVALITGGSKGLGEAMALALASAGADLMIVSRHLNEGQETAATIARSTGIRAGAFQADVTDAAAVQQMVDVTLETYGHIDILINCAGTNVRKPTLELSEAEWDLVMDLNIKAPFLCCKAVAPQMIERRWGRIINLGSVQSSAAMAGRAPYGSSKGGLVQLSRVLALEWAPYNVTVNTLCPGPFKTPMNLPLLNNPQAYADFTANVPLGRWGEPRELGGATLLLASEAGSFITGSALYIDGGWSAR